MTLNSNFRHYADRPTRLTPEFVNAEYAKLHAGVALAEASSDADLWIKLFKNWDALKSYTYSENSRAGYRYSGNLGDPKQEELDTYLREKIMPLLEKGNGELLQAFLISKHREAMSKILSPQLFNTLETQIKPLDPRLADLRMEENRLKSEYRKFMGTAEIEFQGKKMTLTKSQSFRNSTDEAVRKDCFLVYRNWFVLHREKIAQIFTDLVNIRQQMAEKIGDPNYLGLGYMGMGRTDYGLAESANFRKLVRDYVVPIQTKIHEKQAESLGQKTLKPWDVAYYPELALPMDIAPVDTQLDKAQKVFERISPRLAKHFSDMRENNLIDLENRPGKAPGAFCTSFMDEKKAAILCNSTGEASNVTTLMHEMGHAFQCTESMQDDRSIELIFPTMDAAEIHSMGMEYLSLSRLDEYFGPLDLEKFRKDRWKRAIELLCYVAIVDEFQHWVYENPKVSADARDQEWTRIAKIYQPSIDYAGIENLIPTRWYSQNHIFGMPFYYIDYAIAETGAMQLALIDAKDPKRAVEVYLELCRIGGTQSVLNIFKSAGLQSPFSADNMQNLMNYAELQLSN
jgi:M3 family oligoendopeptidase